MSGVEESLISVGCLGLRGLSVGYPGHGDLSVRCLRGFWAELDPG